MPLPAPYHAFAVYNEVMNRKVYDGAATLSDAERKADRGAFFRSIHSTLDHIHCIDIVLLGRLTGTAADVPPIGTDLYDDFSALRAAQEQQDQVLIEWTNSLTTAWLDQMMRWTSQLNGKERHQPPG